MKVDLSSEEIDALEEYAGDNYMQINALLRQGVSTELKRKSRGDKSFSIPTGEEFTKILDVIKKMYSAMVKYTLVNKKCDKTVFRGTKISTVEGMRNEETETSYISSTEDIYATKFFSTISDLREKFQERALVVVDADDVPFFDLGELYGDNEMEVLFAPAKLEVIEGISDSARKKIDEYKNVPTIKDPSGYFINNPGKLYTFKLSPVEIPEISDEEIKNIEEKIISDNSKMAEVLKRIFEESDINPNSEELQAHIQEYSEWKSSVITYIYQQFKLIEKEIKKEKRIEVNSLGKEVINEISDIILEDETERDMEAQEKLLQQTKGNQEVGE